MPRLKLSAPLLVLLPDEERPLPSDGRTIPLRSQQWPALAQEMRERFPDLAARVLTDRDEIVGGFVFVVNDEVMPRKDPSIDLGEDDEVFLLAAIAGG